MKREAQMVALCLLMLLALSQSGYAQSTETKTSSAGTEQKEQASKETAQSPEQAAVQPAIPKDPLRWTRGRFSMKLSIEAGTQLGYGFNTWWNLSQTFAPTSAYKEDRAWDESYLKPGIKLSYALSDKTSLYGGLSAIGSANIGKDVFLQGDGGRVLLEDAYGGVTYKNDKGFGLDLSGGAQQYKIGSGFLISIGAANGFERGAATLFPRKAWQNTGIARVSYQKFSFDAFYLDPNELKSSDSDTKLTGVKTEYAISQDEHLGFAYLNVFQSNYAYIKAPISFIENGRDGLQVAHAYARFRPSRKAAPGLVAQGEFVREWNGKINLRAWAMNAEVNNTFIKTKWMPTLGYAFRYYSGDDPETPELERFDSLYYDGAPTTFSSGSNGGLAFYNSNVITHRLRLNLLVTQRDIFDVFYFHIRAAKKNSPIQFGQGFRFVFVNGVPVLSTGVPNSHLADDLYFQYTRVVNKNIYVTSGVAVSAPGKGLDAISKGASRTWTGGIANVVFIF